MVNIFTDSLNIWILIKVLALVLLGIYLVFAFVVIRQVKLMTDTLHIGFETSAKMLSYIHLALAILVFLTALVIL
ncbi:MAG: DUF5657 family protein [Candidatus Microgenomates bacterium]|jgi:hypothetical protein